MRVAVEYRSTSRKVYDRFIAEHPETNVTFKEWKKILEDFNTLFRDYILETGEKAKFPYGFGPFSISKKKIKKTKEHKGKTYINLPIDWVKTKKEGKRVYNFNAHTSGYRFKWYWFVQEARFYLSDTWMFKPSRNSSRTLGDLLNKPNSIHAQTYKEWEQFKK